MCLRISLLASAWLVGTAHAQQFDPTAAELAFTVDGQDLGSAEVALPADSDSLVAATYDLSTGALTLQLAEATLASGTYDSPLFCFDFRDVASSSAFLSVTDANGHRVMPETDIAQFLSYDLAGAQFILTPPAGFECFYRGLNTEAFGLEGQAPFDPVVGERNEGSIFGDAFAEKVLGLQFQGLQEFVAPGDDLTYDLVLNNASDQTLTDIGLQELFPANADFFDASLSQTSFTCPEDDACTGLSSLNGDGSLRFQGFDLDPGESATFRITRTVDDSSLPETTIRLFAGAVVGGSASPYFDAAEAEVNVVGQAAGLDIDSQGATADGESLADVVVTVLDNEQRPVPNESVSFDSATGGLQVTPASGTTDSSGEVVFQAGPTTDAVDYTVSFTSGALAGNGTVSFFPGPASRAFVAATDAEAVADGNDTITIEVLVEDAEDNPVDSVLVEVTSDDGLTFLPDSVFTDSAGRAVLTATSTTTGTYEPQITVDGVGAFTETVDFVAGAPADLEFVEQPSDVAAGSNMSPAVVVRVVDANGNWVSDDGSTFVEVDLMQGGSVVSNNVADGGVTNGEIEFSALSFDSSLIGTDYYLQAVGTVTGFFGEDSTTFDITDPQ
jgi:uncharacterized repeat protein (TIGR01451 family)